MLKNIYIFSIISIISLSLTACGGKKGDNKKNVYTTIEGSVWHTTMRITYGSERNMTDSVLAVTSRVEQSLSPFLDSSHISLINRGEDLSVDRYIKDVFVEALRVNRISKGSFDPTVAPLVNLWGFGYQDNGHEPTEAEIDSCLQLVGIQECGIMYGYMHKKSSGTQFNFSAITKGYGIDCIARMLEGEGIENYMIEIGGEIALRGVNAKGEKWHIQIDTPDSGREGHEQLSVITVSDCCIATSGNYRNYRDTSRGRVGHTISPATGYPVSSEVLSATVIAPTTMTADALATALMAMPMEAGVAMIESEPGVEALLVVSDGEGYRIVTTPGFPK